MSRVHEELLRSLEGLSGVRHVELGANADASTAPDPADDACMTVFWRSGYPVGHVLKLVDGRQRRIMASQDRPATPVAAPALPTSVVICTRDRPDELRRCLASLPQQSFPAQEIIVVDNASRDARTREVAEAAGVVYVREDRPGLDYARNTGARTATGEIVAYTDDDVLLHPRWLEHLIAAFDEPRIGAVTGLVLPAELATPAQRQFESFWSFGQGYDRIEFLASEFAETSKTAVFPAWKMGAGASMAFRRDVFEKFGYFDNRLGAGQAGCSDDSEFWYRLLANGVDCRYEPTSIAFHYHRREMEGLAYQIYSYMRGHAAALLVQHERTGLTCNRSRALWEMPRWYASRAIRRLRRGPVAEDRFLKQEILGYFSGLLFYYRHRGHDDW